MSKDDDSNIPAEISKEQRILRMVRHVLTDVAKDTVTPAELKHPLSENTIRGIRECLEMITARELELKELTGESNSSRPHFIDEPQTSVQVSITSSNSKPKK